jgi:L-threonylcarbamoyladenylate synthase
VNIETQILTEPSVAVEILRGGGVVAVPTETVYGLAARYDNAASVERIFAVKGRPSDNPLIVHLADASWLPMVAARVPEEARLLLARFAPGPLTVTVPRGAGVSARVTGGLPSVAVRIPREKRVREVLQGLGIPLVAPSANRSGRPSPTTWEAVWDELAGRIDAILVGEPAAVGIESTVVDCCQDPPVLLRPGGISWEQICEVLPGVQVLESCGIAGDVTEVAGLASPGLRYRHYAPRARIVLVNGPEEVPAGSQVGYLGMIPHCAGEQFGVYRLVASVEEYARWLFAVFREADQRGLERIYCQRVSQEGLGRGVMDRLERAARG